MYDDNKNKIEEDIVFNSKNLIESLYYPEDIVKLGYYTILKTLLS